MGRHRQYRHRQTVDDADVVTLVDVSKRPFRAVSRSRSGTPEGVAISPDGRWIAVSSMAGSNLLATDPGRHKLGKVALYAIQRRRGDQGHELPGGEAAQGLVFTQDSKTVIVQFDVEAARDLRDPRRQARRHRRAHQARRRAGLDPLDAALRHGPRSAGRALPGPCRRRA